MSTPQTNTFSCDFSPDAEYPVRFRFPVTWRCISAPLDPAGASYTAPAQKPVLFTSEAMVVPKPKVRESLTPPDSSPQWEMVIPKMARPVPRSAPERSLPAARLPQTDPAPALSSLPRSTLAVAFDAVPLKWKLILLAAVTIGLLVWAWSAGAASRPVSLAPHGDRRERTSERRFQHAPHGRIQILMRSVQC
jgi:hypothetical protein